MNLITNISVILSKVNEWNNSWIDPMFCSREVNDTISCGENPTIIHAQITKKFLRSKRLNIVIRSSSSTNSSFKSYRKQLCIQSCHINDNEPKGYHYLTSDSKYNYFAIIK